MKEFNQEVFGIRDLVAITPFSESYIRNAIRAGQLVARKAGAKVIVTRQDLDQYLSALPTWTSGKAPTPANEARRKQS